MKQLQMASHLRYPDSAGSRTGCLKKETTYKIQVGSNAHQITEDIMWNKKLMLQCDKSYLWIPQHSHFDLRL